MTPGARVCVRLCVRICMRVRNAAMPRQNVIVAVIVSL